MACILNYFFVSASDLLYIGILYAFYIVIRKINFVILKGSKMMATSTHHMKVRAAWKTLLVELLTVRAGFYISQQVNPSSPKRDNIG